MTTTDRKLARRERLVLEGRLAQTRAALAEAERRGIAPRVKAMMRQSIAGLELAILEARARALGLDVSHGNEDSYGERERACLS